MEIRTRVSSTLSDVQYHRLLELLNTAQYKEESQQIKLLLICFYGTLFQPQHLLHFNSTIVRLRGIKNLKVQV